MKVDFNIVMQYLKWPLVKFIYSEKATKFLQNLLQLFDWQYIGQIIGGDFAKFCGLLRIYELYVHIYSVAETYTPNLN